MGRFRRVAMMGCVNPSLMPGFRDGVQAYAAGHGQWVLIENSRIERQWIRGIAADVDGMILMMRDWRIARFAASLGVPCVNASGSLRALGLHTVRIDDAQIGRLAAEYFLARRYKHFAFLGSTHGPCPSRRMKAYYQAIRRQGLACHRHVVPRTPQLRLIRDGVARWVAALERPLALLAASDSLGTLATETCRELGIAVPGEVAVLGVNNIQSICRFSYPPLSSISLGLERWGYEAASLLDRLMNGQRRVPKEVLLPPEGIVTRGSTEAEKAEDPMVAQALQFIREHACDPLSVEQLAKALGTTRRSLERSFHRSLNSTPHREARRVQLERAKRLLAETDLPVAEVAAASGMTSPENLWLVFQKELGVSPTCFRNRHQASMCLSSDSRQHASPKTPYAF